MINDMFTIILPVHNAEKTLLRALSSIQNQTCNEWDLTIVLNNSNAKTKEIALDFLKQNANSNKVEVLECKEKGIVPALNTGLLHNAFKSSNPYIARMDGDDFWYPEKLEKQLKYLENNQDIDILGTQINPVDNINFQTIENCYVHRPENDNEIKYWLFTSRNPIAHPSVVFKKEILLKTGIYDDHYPIAEDYVLWLKAAKWFKFANLKEILMDYTTSHNPNYNPRVPQIACQLYKILYNQI